MKIRDIPSPTGLSIYHTLTSLESEPGSRDINEIMVIFMSYTCGFNHLERMGKKVPDFLGYLLVTTSDKTLGLSLHIFSTLEDLISPEDVQNCFRENICEYNRKLKENK